MLSELSVKSFIEKDFVIVPIRSNLRALVNAVAHSKRNIFPVTDDQNFLVGVISLENIREIMFDTLQYDSIAVDQLMQRPLVTVDVKDDMSIIMEKFDKSGVWNIPILDQGKYIGFVSKSRILSTYRERLKND